MTVRRLLQAVERDALDVGLIGYQAHQSKAPKEILLLEITALSMHAGLAAPK